MKTEWYKVMQIRLSEATEGIFYWQFLLSPLKGVGWGRGQQQKVEILWKLI